MCVVVVACPDCGRGCTCGVVESGVVVVAVIGTGLWLGGRFVACGWKQRRE